jgi:hypothetical protein
MLKKPSNGASLATDFREEQRNNDSFYEAMAAASEI